MSGQTKKGSAAEAATNIVFGYGVNLLANFSIFPFFGWEISLKQNLIIGVFYTLVSLARSYFLRRIYNSIERVEEE
tara:strand:+ start:565 stop:792 length:228 start_codon:yes stop_codon:yes gene_type:complete